MSRARVHSVDHVPHARPQRTPPPAPTISELMSEPKPATPYYGRTLPDEGIGRIPCIGLDSGNIPGTRPDTSPINQR